MSYADLVAYIQEQTQQGVTAQTLREVLMEVGWREFDIENAFHDVAAGLHPATPGASIHEDLAQVRGMVAHLASRMGTVESRLASLYALPMQEGLPLATARPERTLPVGQRPSRVRHMSAVAVGIGVFFAIGHSVTALIPTGALFFIFGYAAMRMHRAWMASLFTSAAIGMFAQASWSAYRVYFAAEGMVAVALAALCGILFIVMERRIDRSVQ